MNLLKIEATNFGSYKHLEFNFQSQGLTLIHGATGSGKSTLQDLVPWVLFGQTAKDGNADDVRRWDTDEPTTAVLEIEIQKRSIKIYRVRGKASENDLYWTEGDSEEKHRGKDISETQKLLNEYLGVSAELYHIAAYYNEYSPTRNFFDSSAKQRRELFENLADLSLPTTLNERIAVVKREVKKAHAQRLEEFNKADGRREQLERTKAAIERDAKRWEENKIRKIEELKARSQGFEKEKQSKIAALQTKSDAFQEQLAKEIAELDAISLKLAKELDQAEEKCDKCGSLNLDTQKKQRRFDEVMVKLEAIANKANPHLPQIGQVQLLENTYDSQITNCELENNPFLSQKDSIICDIIDCQKQILNFKDQVDESNHRLFSLTQLADLTISLRAELLKYAIKHIEAETNRYLETYFDAEIRVQLDLGDSDNLEVLIWKSGHDCSFRQLSKGQKGLLKLCFSVSVMKAASDKAGIHFNALFMDEALDGFDVSLKLKAYNLFSELEKHHETVLVIDHSQELKNLFTNIYCVTLDNDESIITQDC